MAFSAANWIRENKAVYLGNAANIRDFRAQLRGNRPIYLWLSYLAILILIVGLAYNNIVEGPTRSIAQMQVQLGQFYNTVIILLGGVIAIVTPSLTATTVVSERQRKSLDLVFSAPVSLKYYLVGKMLSSLRYTWMLLILALPVTAVCVVMGGATWTDVLSAYLLLTGASLVFTALGLLISVLTNTLVSAVLWTYVIAGFYCLITSAGPITSSISMMSGRSSLEMSWMVGISPFAASVAAPTYTTLWSHHVPNWILVSVYSLLMCKLLLAGAASAMSPFGSAETKSFRLHLVVYVALFTYIIGVSIVQPVAMMMGHSMGSPGYSYSSSGLSPYTRYLWIFPAWIAFALALSLPTFSCFGKQEDRKFRNDGYFVPSRLLLGTPSGSLPFAFVLILSMYFALALAVLPSGVALDTTPIISSLFWSCSFIVFWWAVARLASSMASTLKMARIIFTAAFIVLIALPLPVLSIVEASRVMGGGSTTGSALQVHMLYPLTQGSRSSLLFLAYGALMLVPAISMAAISHFLTSDPRRT